MAHADYVCCAICDDKIYYYDSSVEAKEEICSYCASKTGISNVDELIKKIKNMSKQELKKWMKEVNFKYCMYENDVDNLVKKKLKEMK